MCEESLPRRTVRASFHRHRDTGEIKEMNARGFVGAQGRWVLVSRIVSGAIGQRTKVGQGDIIHKPAVGAEGPRWGFIVTADCDIVQDKAGARLSYLDIVTVRDYLEHVWSSEILRKLRSTILKEAAALISKAAQALDKKFATLSPEDLLEWLTDTPRAEIVSALEVQVRKQKQHLEALEKVELAFELRIEGGSALQRLRRVWAVQGSGEKAMRGRLEQALDYNQATDFHLIPAIPGSEPLGYVVLLREISSIPHDHIFPSALALQIDGNEEGYYVAGPSTDNLRYAISQKMAFLFSRIGMSDEYESQCGVVSQLALDELASIHDLTGTAQ